MSFKFSDLYSPQTFIDAGIGFMVGGPPGAVIGAGMGAAQASSARDAQDAARQANEANISYAQQTNATEIELANTAHQREVADLKAAGINPILAARLGGSVTPNLTAPSMQSLAPVIQQSAAQNNAMIQSGLSAGLQAKLQTSQMALNSASAAKAAADAGLSVQQARLASAQQAKIEAEVPGVREESAKRAREAGQGNRYPSWLNAVGQGWKDFGNTVLDPLKGIFGASMKW